MITLVILISGRGSNLTSLLNAAASGAMPARIVGVISNRPDALGLQTAEAHGVPTCVIDHRGFAEREQFDVAVAAAIDGFAPDLVVLAGFMRILGKAFVRRYENRLINIHPSLLPA
ncbi:MAG TPA: formyltransferase family protein, partial [Candidatus Accumulibacter phosphatis]|nr:formyltransferase family protein [Candidatus Accumulibacter phosphatis]